MLNGAASDNDKVSSLIIPIGPKMYAILKNVMFPCVIKNQKFETIIRKLKGQNYCPKQLIISERYKFNMKKKKNGESVSKSIIELCRISSSCQFNTFLTKH